MKRAALVLKDLEEITIRAVKLAAFMLIGACIVLLECGTLLKVLALFFPHVGTN